MRRKDLESDWNNRSSGYTIRTGVVGARPAMSAATREDLGERSEGRTARHSVDTGRHCELPPIRKIKIRFPRRLNDRSWPECEVGRQLPDHRFRSENGLARNDKKPSEWSSHKNCVDAVYNRLSVFRADGSNVSYTSTELPIHLPAGLDAASTHEPI